MKYYAKERICMPSTAKKEARQMASCGSVSVLVILLISAGLIALALYTHSIADAQTQAQQAPIAVDDPDPNAPVTCENAPMSPGDICDHVTTLGNGGQVTTHYSYEEQQQYQAKQRIEQERNRIEAQRSKSPPPTALIGCVSGLLWIFGVIAGLLALVLFIGVIQNVVSPSQKSASPETSSEGSPENPLN
jgi:hypothetical protein